MTIEQFNPQESAAVRDYISEAARYRHAVIFGQALLEISNTFGKLDLQEIERTLRDIYSSTTLIALPSIEMPEFMSMLPHTGEKQFPYYLYISVNGRQEAEKLMNLENLTYELNFERLPETGMLVPKKGFTYK